MGPGCLGLEIFYVDVPAGSRNFDFYYTYFCPHLPPISIPISTKFLTKTRNFAKMCGFYDNLLKMDQIYVKLSPFNCDKKNNKNDRYTKI